MKITYTRNLYDHSIVDIEVSTSRGTTRSEIKFRNADEAKLFLREIVKDEE